MLQIQRGIICGMNEKNTKKILTVVSVLLFLSLIANFLMAIDNGSLIQQQEKFETLAGEYDQSFNRFILVTDCIDNLPQYEIDDGTVVVKALDIQGCTEKVSEAIMQSSQNEKN